MPIQGLTFQVTTKLLQVNNKVFDTLNQIKFFKNILIRNVWSSFWLIESLLPLKSTIVKQRIPHNLGVFSTS